jgi:hypothetical protein
MFLILISGVTVGWSAIGLKKTGRVSTEIRALAATDNVPALILTEFD